MSAPRGDSEQTKAEILAAAQRLFAEQGISAVSVRDVASEAGVTHGLIHHYFGTKEQLAAAAIRAAVSASAEVLVANPVDTDLASLDVMRRVLRYFLTDGKGGALLLARAELGGFEPEKMETPGMVRSLRVMAERFAHLQTETLPPGDKPDPALIAVFVGAAMVGLIIMHPWLMTTVGLRPEDFDGRIDEIIEIAIAFVGLATGLLPQPS